MFTEQKTQQVRPNLDFVHCLRGQGHIYEMLNCRDGFLIFALTSRRLQGESHAQPSNDSNVCHWHLLWLLSKFLCPFLIPLAYNSFCDVNWPVFFIEKLEGIIKKGNPIKKTRLMVERISNTPLCLQWVGCVFTVRVSWYHTLPDHLPPWSCVFSEILFKKIEL